MQTDLVKKGRIGAGFIAGLISMWIGLSVVYVVVSRLGQTPIEPGVFAMIAVILLPITLAKAEGVVPQNVVPREMFAAMAVRLIMRTELGPSRAPTARHARVALRHPP
jgi:hypothetical protein